MLNEGLCLLRNLREVGYEIQSSHPDIKKPGKNAGYVVGLGEDGYPQTVNEIDQNEMIQLWTHREGKWNSFPVIRVQTALLSIRQKVSRAESRAKKKKHATQEARMVKVLERCVRIFPLARPDNGLWDRLQGKARQFLIGFNDENENFAAWALMLRRFTMSDVTPEKWFMRFIGLVIQRLKEGKLRNVALADKLLIGSLNKRRPDKPADAKVPLVLDVAETNCPISVADPRMGEYVSRRLQSLEINDPDGVCALQGTPAALLKKRFPEPNLGPLGETKLFSKNRSTPCEFRYLKNSNEWEDASNSFPVGSLISADIADSLKTVTKPELKGKTWRMVMNGKWEGRGRNKKEKRALLIIYCEGSPIIDAQIADIFGNDNNEKIDQFERDAKAICRALEGTIKHRPKTILHLLIIGKADKEKKHLQLHMSPSVREVLDAAERWQKIPQTNLPPVILSLPPLKKGEKVLEAKPSAPYPDRLVRLLSGKWVREGLEEYKTQGPSLSIILELMLGNKQKRQETAQLLLDLTINRTTSLLIGLFGAKHAFGPQAARGRIDLEPLSNYTRWSKVASLNTTAMLGILLSALNIKKEVYMKDAPFLVGQILSLADTLHKNYCTVVRRGQMPNALIGSSLMRRALDNPAGALADLGERITEYLRWAKVVQISGSWPQDDQRRIAVNEARKKLRQYKPIAKDLSGCNLPQECNEVMKAQLLLGFLATPPDVE